ncbi:hypothetical protein [Maribellus sediminis]|uniref:hypothetical protein n=1 Tax=Maribellus sediminis TaxID=2696285 RepID=UPI0014300E7F|nr:hypothetical protein [Maribellus sediminis]
MKYCFPLFFLLIGLFSCTEPEETEPEMEPCDFYATGHFKDTIPGKIPELYWPCMETKDLVDAVSYNFPSLYIQMAGCCGLQSGYDMVKRSHGFPELESREDALENLIAKYISIDTIHYNRNLLSIQHGGFNFYTYNLEVVLAQEVFLKSATKQQKLDLLNELKIKQDLRNGESGDYAAEGPTFATSRVMFFDDYQPLLDSMQQNHIIKSIVELGTINHGTEAFDAAQNTIFVMAGQYALQL